MPGSISRIKNVQLGLRACELVGTSEFYADGSGRWLQEPAASVGLLLDRKHSRRQYWGIKCRPLWNILPVFADPYLVCKPSWKLWEQRADGCEHPIPTSYCTVEVGQFPKSTLQC